MKVVKTRKMPDPSWQAQTRSTHIWKVVLVMVFFFIIIGLVIFGLVYPKCNETQVRGFFQCNCPDGSALQKSSGLCICLNNGTELGNQCEEGAADVRYVFSTDTQNDWEFTNAAIWNS